MVAFGDHVMCRRPKVQMADKQDMSSLKKMSICVAVAKNGVIGANGTIPWPRLNTDMKTMRIITSRAPEGKQNAVILGRKTFLSVPKKVRPLKNRYNVVLTTKPSEVPDAHATVSSVTEAVEMLSTPPLSDKIHEIHVLGGTQVYAEVLLSPLLDRVYFTDVKQSFDGDTFFPPWDKEGFEIIEDPDVPGGLISENGVEYDIKVYQRTPTT